MASIRTFQRAGFGRSGGTYECSVCMRLTRRTVSGQTDMCAQCDEVAMIENGLSDGGYETEAEIADAEATMLRLKKEAAKKGGNLARLGLPAQPEVAEFSAFLGKKFGLK